MNEFYKSYFVQSKGDSREVGVGNRQSSHDLLFVTLRGNEWLSRGNQRHLWNPEVISYSMMPRFHTNSTMFSSLPRAEKQDIVLRSSAGRIQSSAPANTMTRWKLCVSNVHYSWAALGITGTGIGDRLKSPNLLTSILWSLLFIW